jgi:hypothetical protein
MGDSRWQSLLPFDIMNPLGLRPNQFEEKMARASKSTALSQSKPVLNPIPKPSSSEWLRPSIIGMVLLLLMGLGLDILNQGGISCFSHKYYPLKLIEHIRGVDQACGAFKAGGVSFVQGGQIEVSDTDHNRTLLFDMKGQFLQALPNVVPMDPKTVTDVQSGLTYTAEWDRFLIQVTDKNGKVQRNIYVKDHPIAVALDGKGTLFVSFANHYFLQVFSVTGQFKGDGQVINPDQDQTYLDVKSLSVTDQGLLLAADSYSVWIYQIPQ